MLVACAAGAPAGDPACTPSPEVVVAPGRYGPYYHVCVALGAASIDFAASDLEASSGGQFELRVRADAIPAPAPRCENRVILRMPWTSPRAHAHADKVAAKRSLLARIRALEGDALASLPVVVELNPYVEVLGEAPLALALTRCNVFFRHADGGYVDHLGPRRGPR